MDMSDLQQPRPSPLLRLLDEEWDSRGVALWIKRDDLLAPESNSPFCGNKWRKLQYNLLAAREQGYERLLTFGGAYSNHIAALAEAGAYFGFHTVGVIRGEAVRNPTLDRAQARGMHLHFIDRPSYRQKMSPAILQDLQQRFDPYYLIPEGGTNAQALLGCAALAQEILTQATEPPTHLALACGTGGTLAGAIQGLDGECQALGVSVLKGNFMQKAVAEHLANYTQKEWPSWSVVESFHHGGYAKNSKVLDAYIQDFHQQHGILLEPIYTGKLFYALHQLLLQGHFPVGSSVVAVHTGGLQAYGSRI